MTPYYDVDGITIYCGDCLEVISEVDIVPDKILTDPPYPDYYEELYKQTPIDFLGWYSCRQFVFWSSKCEFPLDYSAIHIWDKKTGVGSEYERIFERNGEYNYKMFRHYLINSTVAASYTGDVFTGHKSQKPIALILDLVIMFTNQNDIIFDPFMGSGTTLVAAQNEGRRAVGIEISEEYCKIAVDRLRQKSLFSIIKPEVKQPEFEQLSI